MDALLEFMFMPLLGVASALLCIGILFFLNHIANGYLSPPHAIESLSSLNTYNPNGSGNRGHYAFDGLVNVPSSTIDTGTLSAAA
jgi:hypothetical protein